MECHQLAVWICKYNLQQDEIYRVALKQYQQTHAKYGNDIKEMAEILKIYRIFTEGKNFKNSSKKKRKVKEDTENNVYNEIQKKIYKKMKYGELNKKQLFLSKADLPQMPDRPQFINPKVSFWKQQMEKPPPIKY